MIHPIAGSVLWSQNYEQPVVAMYLAGNDGLRKVPFISMAAETLDHLTGQMSSDHWRERFLDYERDQVF